MRPRSTELKCGVSTSWLSAVSRYLKVYINLTWKTMWKILVWKGFYALHCCRFQSNFPLVPFLKITIKLYCWRNISKDGCSRLPLRPGLLRILESLFPNFFFLLSDCALLRMEYYIPSVMQLTNRSWALQSVRKSLISLSSAFNNKIPLYTTGHFFGRALASLFYPRLRKWHELDGICGGRDTDVWLCPDVGDTDFCYRIGKVRCQCSDN